MRLAGRTAASPKRLTRRSTARASRSRRIVSGARRESWPDCGGPRPDTDTPMRRTGWARRTREKRVSTARKMTRPSWVGSPVCARVMVEKSAKRSLRVTVRPAQLARHPLTLLAEGGAEQLDVSRVAPEGFLRPHGLGRAVRLHASLVVAAGELEEPGSVLAEARLEMGGGDPGELADGADAHGFELGARDFPYAPEARDGERGKELRLAPGLDDDHPVRLLQLGGDLGHEHVRGDAYGGGKVHPCLDAALDLAGDGRAVAVQGAARRDVEEGLVDRQGLDERGEISEEAHDVAGNGGVLVHVHAQVDAFRAQTIRAADGHGGVDPETAGFIGGGRDHTAAARVSADDDGAAPDLGAVALLDRRVERVHVHVDDGPGGGRGAHGRTRRRGRRDRCWARRR